MQAANDSVTASVVNDQSTADIDPWDDVVTAFLRGRQIVTVSEILANALGLEVRGHSMVARSRVARIIREAGWRSGTALRNGRWAACFKPLSMRRIGNLKRDISRAEDFLQNDRTCMNNIKVDVDKKRTEGKEEDIYYIEYAEQYIREVSPRLEKDAARLAVLKAELASRTRAAA